MSGIEITGLILNIIPLIRSACKSSDSSDSLLRRVAILGSDGFATEIRNIRSTFDTQKAIFRARADNFLPIIQPDPNGAIPYLEPYFDHETYDSNTQTKYIKDEKLDVLRELLRSCQRTLEEITEHLVSITSALKPFQENPSDSHQTLTDLTLRVRLVWEQSQIKHKVRKFKEANDLFSTLVNGIIKLLTHGSGNRRELKHGFQRTIDHRDKKSRLYAYENVQHASSELYRTLSEKWRCGVHESHVVHLASVQESERYIACSPVSFKTVVTGVDGDRVQHHNFKTEVQHDQLKVSTDRIDSYPVDEQPSTSQVSTKNEQKFDSGLLPYNLNLQSLYSTLKKSTQEATSEDTTHGKRVYTKRPRFHLMHDNVPLESLMMGSTSAEKLDPHPTRDSVTDLQDIPDHCSHLKEQDKYCSRKACWGYFAGECNVRFYIQPESQNLDKHFLSLHDLIRQTSEDSLTQVLPLPQIMNFASIIADAMLQFYSSPWLPERWNSKDIHFSGAKKFKEIGEYSEINSLYVSLRFGKDLKDKEAMGRSETPQAEHTSNISMTQNFDEGIRNERLFCFGVVLLEIGYTKPWNVLRSALIKKWPTHPGSNYFIADTLARRLVKHVGIDYVRVTRKCIGCDFDLGGTNLDNEELQAEFFQDVIEALRAVKARLPVF